MFLLVLFTTIVFLFTIFIGSLPANNDLNPFTAYLQTQGQFIANNLTLFIIGFIITLFLLMATQKSNKKFLLVSNYFFSIMQTFLAGVVGLFAAFAVILIIACIELNFSAFAITTYPGLMGIQTDPTTIITTIKENNVPPDVVASDNDPDKELLAITRTSTGNNNYFGRYALTAIPQFLILPIKQDSATMVLIDNTLIITSLRPTELQQISPIIGYYFLKSYFWRRQLKDVPNFALMNRSEYVKYRLQDTKEKAAKIDLDIAKLSGDISSFSAMIQQDQKLLAAPNLRPGSATANSLQDKLQNDRNILSDYQNYANFFKAQRTILSSQAANLPNELGVFVPQNTIKVILDTTNAHTIADYLETVTHEYLHYVSYISREKKFSHSFFEEGLTEYFARNIIQKELQTNTNLGYPVEVKIITEMTKIIPESEFVDLYFSKDEALLADTLDRAYGDSFYEDNEVLFETLQYTSNRQQALKIANIIMKKIGGSPVTEKDLYSNYTKI